MGHLAGGGDGDVVRDRHLARESISELNGDVHRRADGVPFRQRTVCGRTVGRKPYDPKDTRK